MARFIHQRIDNAPVPLYSFPQRLEFVRFSQSSNKLICKVKALFYILKNMGFHLVGIFLCMDYPEDLPIQI